MLCTQQHKLQNNDTDGFAELYSHSYTQLPVQFPDDESRNVPPPQLSAVHTLGAAPRRVSGSLHVTQYAESVGLEQVAQEL